MRGALGFLLAGAGVAVLLTSGWTRALETRASSSLVGFVTGTRTMVFPAAHTFYWAVGTHRILGMKIDAECSTAFVIGPLLILAAIVAGLGPRVTSKRLLFATSVTMAAVFAVNVIRIAFIAGSTYRWGVKPGFEWSHSIFGSLFTIVGIGAALVLFVVILARGRRPGSEA